MPLDRNIRDSLGLSFGCRIEESRRGCRALTAPRNCAGKGTGKPGGGNDDDDDDGNSRDGNGGQKRPRDSSVGGTSCVHASGGAAPATNRGGSNTGGGSTGGAGPAANGGGSNSPQKKSLDSPVAKKAKKPSGAKPHAKRASSPHSKENTSLAGNSGNGEEVGALSPTEGANGKSDVQKQRAPSLTKAAHKSNADRESLDGSKKQPTLSAFLKPVKQ